MSKKDDGLKAPDSSIVILRLLDSEGYSSHASNMVKKYWKRNIMDQRRKLRVQRAERAFSEMVKNKLDDADRIVLGKMMGLHARMNFDTGLRVGLSARLAEASYVNDGAGEEDTGKTGPD